MTTTKPMKTIRSGMIAASVWPREGKRGKYAEFTLSRTFRNGEAFKYATTFRARDGQALREVIDEAVKWMDSEGFVSALNGTDGSQAAAEEPAASTDDSSTGGEDATANG